MTRKIVGDPGASVSYEVVGEGTALLALHGAYSAGTEVQGFLEPMLGDRPLRRIYPDLPGHGRSRPSGAVRSPDDALDLLDLVLDAEAPGDEPVLMLGHSFGGHFARALAARHPDRVLGLALLCPVMTGEWLSAPSHVVRDDGVSSQLHPGPREEYEGYFVVRTAETLQRFRDAVAPALGPVDDETLDAAIDVAPPRADPDAVAFDAPVLVAVARHDTYVGWRRQQELVDRYPRATVITVADAGHALPHERPDLVAALLRDWLDRV